VAENERQRGDLQSESRLLFEWWQLCDLAIFCKEARDVYEDAKDMEMAVLAKSRISAWRAARKKARMIVWVGGKPTIPSTGKLNISGRARNVQNRDRAPARDEKNAPPKNKKGKTCHKCGSSSHFSYDCTHSSAQPASFWSENPGAQAKKQK
jgi:hypothetical protein